MKAARDKLNLDIFSRVPGISTPTSCHRRRRLPKTSSKTWNWRWNASVGLMSNEKLGEAAADRTDGRAHRRSDERTVGNRRRTLSWPRPEGERARRAVLFRHLSRPGGGRRQPRWARTGRETTSSHAWPMGGDNLAEARDRVQRLPVWSSSDFYLSRPRRVPRVRLLTGHEATRRAGPDEAAGTYRRPVGHSSAVSRA